MKKKINFEGNIQRLQEISQLLEEGTLPMNDLIELYEEGIKLANECRQFLDEATMKIETISKDFEQNE
ncbi:MAG TPA: exodeoxyribonuclease VII small subunit [Candidatus Kapabacteria bacterium]|nr:exodeoxyribonuclease VII small subunit [Candidatus Kapabacteria bacterium]HOM04180.1 exodeoxyribonuclease VII small subunit [Candidatus Kapabacteria bacterium]HPU24525.1 exodeoxyribonuclease VII small subunit [Candidatus Kapabacteria bacterium]